VPLSLLESFQSGYAITAGALEGAPAFSFGLIRREIVGVIQMIL
jgi:hypothetical protein